MSELRLRFADPERDGPRLAEIYAPAVIERPTSFELDAPDGAAMANRVRALAPRYPWLVGERDDRVVGYAYASPHRERPAYRWSVDVSAYVDASMHRRGAGRALYTALFTLLEAQGYCGAFAGIALPNDASVALHRAVGFRLVGTYHAVGYKLGAWHDVAWYERPLAARASPPGEPIPYTSLDAGAITRALALRP